MTELLILRRGEGDPAICVPGKRGDLCHCKNVIDYGLLYLKFNGSDEETVHFVPTRRQHCQA